MNPKKHFEEIRHLFRQHTKLMLDIAYKMGPDDADAEIEQILVDMFFKDEDASTRKEPHQQFNYISGRADVVPPDVKSARPDGKPKALPGKFREANAEMPTYTTPLKTDRDYPDDPPHQEGGAPS